jgi:hypothetical protein
MSSAARELEPDPLPADLPNKAPILSDIERGYAKDDGTYEEADGPDAKGRRESGVNSGSREREASGSKEKKVKGKGLTEGDEGQLLDPLRLKGDKLMCRYG